ncbi:MAG: VCBS repeat-containing protein, partial [Bacteroidota bacterium]
MNKYLLCLFVLLLTGSWRLSAQAELVSFTQRNDLLGPASGGISNSDCAVDMNKDGLDDIVRVQNDGINVDYQRTDGTFSHQFFPVSFSNSPNWSICAADIDENGY